jgi:beta-glucosidase
MGQSVGLEGMATNLQGWYAPGVNMHRSPFNGRNYEYYSEDPVLNGYMASEVILGAKSKGLYCYIKHFTLSEPGDNARNLNTWLTEQNFREMYLKPFEIAVKKGGANAIMSAFNFVGGVWAGANAAMNVDILRNE